MLVEMTVAGIPVPGVRIERVRDAELVLTLPDGTTREMWPGIGETVTLRWPAGSRGRYFVAATVVPAPGDERVGVFLEGEPELEQQREFFRGGGGERIRLMHTVDDLVHTVDDGTAVFNGWVQDLSERGARSHFADVRVREGDRVTAQVGLDDETVDVTGTVLRILVLPDGVGAYSMRVEVVVLFDSNEQQARAIRRYVFRQQLLARTRNDDD
jgi:hypothetical protein